MNYSAIIAIDPAIRSGKPHLAGTRLTVSDVLEYLASGMSPSQLCEDFPELTPTMIQASLSFAAERERQLHGGFHA